MGESSRSPELASGRRLVDEKACKEAGEGSYKIEIGFPRLSGGCGCGATASINLSLAPRK